MDLKDRYEVTPEKRQDEFYAALARIKKDFIQHDCKSDSPSFVFAGGQPGSGKTSLVETIKSDNEDINFVVIDLDEFRKYHPDFKEIREKHQKDGVLLTNSFAFAIENEMLSYVVQNKLNTINVSTLRNTELIARAIIDKILSSRFKVRAYVMAVSPEESYISAVARYYEQQSNSDCVARFTSKEFHDAAYEGLDRTLERFVELKIPITVCRRALVKDANPIIIYDEERKVDFFDVRSPILSIEQARKNGKGKNRGGVKIFYEDDDAR